MTSTAPDCGQIKLEVAASDGEIAAAALHFGSPEARLAAAQAAIQSSTTFANLAPSAANNVAAAAAAAASSSSSPGPLSPYTGRQMSRQLLEEFMIAYRHNQCLWKIKSKDYLNKDLKFKAYKQLVQICRKEHRAAGREFVVKKINSLRGSFRREYKRVISEENYVPQLWFYDLMQFTADQETSDEIDSAAAAAAASGFGQSLMVVGGGGGAGICAEAATGVATFGLAGGCYDYQSFGGDETLRDKFKSEDDDNSNSNLSFQILHHSAYSDAVTAAASNVATTPAASAAASSSAAPGIVVHAGPSSSSAADDYSNCMENDTVEQELIINSSNPMVDGNGPQAVAASAAAISESTSVGLDYIANNLNIQHHETCPSVAVAVAVLDDAVAEEGIIEPDVILPANLMSDDSPASPGDGGGVPQEMQEGDFDADATALMSAVAEGFSNGGRGIVAAAAANLVNPAAAGRSTLAGSTGVYRPHRMRRSLRRFSRESSDKPSAITAGSDPNNGDRYDEFMAFGVTVAAKLSKMNVYQRLYAENIINQTLFRGMLNQLQPPPPESDTYQQQQQQLQQNQPQPAQQFFAPDAKMSPDFGAEQLGCSAALTTTIKRESPS